MKLLIKIVIHGIFWVVFEAFSVLMSLAGKTQEGFPANYDMTPHFIVNTLWAIFAFYISYMYLMQYFERRQFVRYLLYSIIVCIALTLCMMPLHKVILRSFEVLSPNALLPPVLGTFIIAQCGSLVRGFENWFASMKLKAELENRNLRNELELLKSQVNPHFLFNTLNNIDSLIYTSPDAASKSLITLSELLRYMIYETNADTVPLEKEINYIRKYVELQRLRFKSPETVSLRIEAGGGSTHIAPLLFIPFVENAFKYAESKGKMPVVDISLKDTAGSLTFRCVNYFNPSKISSRKTGGVGLENVKRRLELLYKGKSELTIEKINDTFTVELKLFQ